LVNKSTSGKATSNNTMIIIICNWRQLGWFNFNLKTSETRPDVVLHIFLVLDDSKVCGIWQEGVLESATKWLPLLSRLIREWDSSWDIGRSWPILTTVYGSSLEECEYENLLYIFGKNKECVCIQFANNHSCLSLTMTQVIWVIFEVICL